MALVRSPVASDSKVERKYGITIANVGDSRALLIRSDGRMISLSNDHKPELTVEKARIMAAGGFVQANRVDGQLAMSRAFGDWPYKGNSKLKADEQKVIAVPEIMTETAYDGDALLICCDGIFEQLSNEQVAAYVYGIIVYSCVVL
jgi:serine/threonine protein phosphatase PrpC